MEGASRCQAEVRAWMPQQPQQLDLPQYPSRVGDVIKHIVDLFNGHFLPRLVVHR